MSGIHEFVCESNRIEGILREPTQAELDAHITLLAMPEITVVDLQVFAGTVQPGATIRDIAGLNVQVGSHIAPPGGPRVRTRLEEILGYASRVVVEEDVYKVHQRYEHLHPFTDSNGRSGRALWLWCMTKQLKKGVQLGFLHHWYYQSLQAWQEKQ